MKKIVILVALCMVLLALPGATLAQEFVEEFAQPPFPHEMVCFNISGYETFCRIKDADIGAICYLYRGGYEAGGALSCVTPP